MSLQPKKQKEASIYTGKVKPLSLNTKLLSTKAQVYKNNKG